MADDDRFRLRFKVTAAGIRGLDLSPLAGPKPSLQAGRLDLTGMTGTAPLADLIGRFADLDEIGFPGKVADVAPKYTGPGLDELHSDPLWRELTKITDEQIESWDNLAYARAFRDAFELARSLHEKGFNNPMQRRELVNQLMSLMPPSAQWDQAFGRDGMKEEATRLFNPLPMEIIDRFPDFELRPGDLPKLGPAFAALDAERAELSKNIFKAGQPGLFFTSDNRLVKIDEIVEDGGKKIAVCTAPAQHRYAVGDHGFYPQGEMHPEERGIRVAVEELESRVFGQCLDNAHQLNSGSAQDRMIALTYASELRGRSLTLNGQTQSVFQWIETAGPHLSVGELRQIQMGAQDAATQAIAKYTAHPRRIHFKIDTREDWAATCQELLKGITGSTPGQYTGQRLGGDQTHIDERNWTSRILGARDSFYTGNANCVGSGAMRAKLLNTMLRPLGIWPEGTSASGFDSHGAFFERFATPNPQTGTLELSEPMNVKMNERTWHYPVHIGIGLGEQHGGRFSLSAGKRSWDPSTSAAGYQSFINTRTRT
jgi:hypothetical protein